MKSRHKDAKFSHTDAKFSHTDATSKRKGQSRRGIKNKRCKGRKSNHAKDLEQLKCGPMQENYFT